MLVRVVALLSEHKEEAQRPQENVRLLWRTPVKFSVVLGPRRRGRWHEGLFSFYCDDNGGGTSCCLLTGRQVDVNWSERQEEKPPSYQFVLFTRLSFAALMSSLWTLPAVETSLWYIFFSFFFKVSKLLAAFRTGRQKNKEREKEDGLFLHKNKTCGLVTHFNVLLSF